MQPVMPYTRRFRHWVFQGLIWGVLLLLGWPLQVFAAEGIRIRADQQLFEPFNGYSQFSGNVKIAMEGTEIVGPQADIKMSEDGKAETAEFTNRSKMVRKTGGTKQTIQADNLKMKVQSGALYAQGRVVTQMSGDSDMGNVTIESDTQVFDQEKHQMKAIGHVKVKKEDLSITSPEALILLGDGGAAEKVIFTKGAKMVQGGQELVAETITIRLSTGDVYAEKNTKSIFVDKDNQGQPTKISIQAHLQEIKRDTGTLIANGNTVIHYGDYVAKGPKATIYRLDNQLDRIVMPGRAQIEDPERRVAGDTVIITANPRQFTAQGNVTTFIKANQQNKVATNKRTEKQVSTDEPASSQQSSNGNTLKEIEEELIIENATKESGNTP